MTGEMKIYEALEIESAINLLAEENEGEISEDDFRLLIEAQTTELSKVENVCRYVKHLEYFADACKQERTILAAKQQAAENRIESIKKFLNPFIQQKGKFDAGVFKLSDRKSERTEIINEDEIPAQFKIIKQIITVDKDAVKKAIKAGEIVNGAQITEHHSTQIK